MEALQGSLISIFTGLNAEWPMVVPILITVVSIVLFVVLVLDEDEEALAEQRRPYHVSEINKASPGARINLED